MGTINVTLGDATQLNLPLGRQLENEVTEVVFDFSAWNTTYGAGTLSLSVQRKGDEMPYPVTMTVSGTNATWEVTDTDTARKGTGKAQLTYTVGDAVKKSVIYKFTVYESLGTNGEYPAPGETWVDEMEADITSLQAQIGNLANLDTEDKSNLVAAINEAAQSGGGGGGGTSPAPYTSDPAALGTANPGSSTKYSKGDHVHPMPSAGDVGAIPSPSSPATGAFLVWDGSAWVAQTLSTWQGGNY